MENTAPFCHCTNQHLLIVNGFCEICMGPVSHSDSHNDSDSETSYGPEYFEDLEFFLDSQSSAA